MDSSRLVSVAAMRFMDVAVLVWQGAEVWVSRSGYTGEDGFEILIPQSDVVAFASQLALFRSRR